MVDAVAAAWGFPKFRRPFRWRAHVAEGDVAGERVALVKPQTFMNRSGQALGPLLNDPDFSAAEHLLVVVDEVALPLGTYRLRARGSAGGHNGLKSIAGRLQSEEYSRLRIGVGPRPDDEDQSSYILDPFEDEEYTQLEALLPELVDVVACWVGEGVESAMNRYNRRGAQRD